MIAATATKRATLERLYNSLPPDEQARLKTLYTGTFAINRTCPVCKYRFQTTVQKMNTACINCR